MTRSLCLRRSVLGLTSSASLSVKSEDRSRSSCWSASLPRSLSLPPAATAGRWSPLLGGPCLPASGATEAAACPEADFSLLAPEAAPAERTRYFAPATLALLLPVPVSVPVPLSAPSPAPPRDRFVVDRLLLLLLRTASYRYTTGSTGKTGTSPDVRSTDTLHAMKLGSTRQCCTASCSTPMMCLATRRFLLSMPSSNTF